MAVSRLADRRIREEAARAALRLDVRGPVSEALGKTGIVVPPASAEPSTEAAPASTPLPEAPALRGVRPAERVVKPFEKAAWPTRRARRAGADPLSGLTADERRVHRILLSQLDLANAQSQSGIGSLTYVETKRLESLDLAFINAELAKMTERRVQTAEVGRVGLLTAVVLAPLALGVALVAGAGIEAVLIALAVLMAVSSALLAQSAAAGPSTPRRQIYEALRELALLLDGDATSEAVLQADLLIDQLADADTSVHTPTARRRVRS
ncbi:hypothetical protein [Rubrivirga marina]|uniref:Uncharacterized protein n=1 Tax=Rubrivirga marina TaxID=1196024 RepID=A0A271IVD9_9BACT|nr:hypothetical protein [Rubrivirga marina]PAP75162.1 hypothetical protein BSZ37_01240 [Rubrivirga marina]